MTETDDKATHNPQALIKLTDGILDKHNLRLVSGPRFLNHVLSKSTSNQKISDLFNTMAESFIKNSETKQYLFLKPNGRCSESSDVLSSLEVLIVV